MLFALAFSLVPLSRSYAKITVSVSQQNTTSSHNTSSGTQKTYIEVNGEVVVNEQIPLSNGKSSVNVSVENGKITVVPTTQKLSPTKSPEAKSQKEAPVTQNAQKKSLAVRIIETCANIFASFFLK